jgi:hypothetical protein
MVMEALSKFREPIYTDKAMYTTCSVFRGIDTFVLLEIGAVVYGITAIPNSKPV